MLKLFSLFVFLCIGYIPTYGSKFDTTKLLQTDFLEYNGIHALSQNFLNVIKTPPEQFINLKIDKQSDYRYEASGVYRLIPYYQRIFPADSETSRFIIQKHPMNGEWLLTEIYASLFHKTIYSFTKEKQSENPIRDAVVVKAFSIFQEQVEEMKKQNVNFKEEIDLKTKRINFLKQDYEAKIEKIKEEFEQKLHEQENQRIKLENPYEKLKFEIKQTFKEKQRLNEKKNVEEKQEIKKKSQTKIEDIEKQFQAKIQDLEKKLLEKENEINNFKTQLTKCQKLNENLKLENNGFTYNQNILEEKIKICLSSYESVEKAFKETKIQLKEFEKKSNQVKKNLQKTDSIKNKISVSENFYEIKSEPFNIINTENKEKIEIEYEKKLLFLKNENHKLLAKIQNETKFLEKQNENDRSVSMKVDTMNIQLTKSKALLGAYKKLNATFNLEIQELEKKVSTLCEQNQHFERQAREAKEKLKIADEKLLEKDNQIKILQNELEIKRCSKFSLGEDDCDENDEEEMFKLFEVKTEIEDLSNVGTDDIIVSTLIIPEQQKYKKMFANKEFEKEYRQLHKCGNSKSENEQCQEAILIMRDLETENQMIHDLMETTSTQAGKEKQKFESELLGKEKKIQEKQNEVHHLQSRLAELENKRCQAGVLSVCQCGKNIEKQQKIKMCCPLTTKLTECQNINESLNLENEKCQKSLLNIYKLNQKLVSQLIEKENQILAKNDQICNLENKSHDDRHCGRNVEYELRKEKEKLKISKKSLDNLTTKASTAETTCIAEHCKGTTKTFEIESPNLEEENNLKEFQASMKVEPQSSQKIIRKIIFTEEKEGLGKIMLTDKTNFEEVDLKKETELAKITDEKVEDNLAKDHDVMLKHMKTEYDEFLVNFFYKKIHNMKDMTLRNKIVSFFNEHENVGWIDVDDKYAQILINYGAIVYVEEQRIIKGNLKFLETIHYDSKNGEQKSMEKWWINNGKLIYFDVLENIYKNHKKLLDDIFDSFENNTTSRKLKTKCKFFMKKKELFEKTKYEYENVLKLMGYVIYGMRQTMLEFGHTIQIFEEKKQQSLREAMLPEDIINLKEVDSKEEKKLTEITGNELIEGYDVMMKHIESKSEKLVNSYCKKVNSLKDMDLHQKILNFYCKSENVPWTYPSYQYEFLFVHHGAIEYITSQQNLIDENFDFLKSINVNDKNWSKETRIEKWWKETGKDIYLDALQKIKKKHDTLLQNTLKSVEDEKSRLLFELFEKYPKLFNEPKYEYESLLRDIGYIHYGSLYTRTYFICMKGDLQ